MAPISARRSGRRRGTILLDTLVGIFMLMVCSLGFLSLFPVIHRSQRISMEESIATQLAGRMVEHLQTLRASDINGPTLAQLNLIDPNQTSGPYSFSHVPLDEGSDYSPAKALRNGTGLITITSLDNNSVEIDVQVGWRSSSGKLRSIQTGTIIGGYR